jgi:integrative and conjugative element protein (TIGR02256 family)
MILSLNSDKLIVVAEEVEATMRMFVLGHEGAREAGGIFIGCYRGPHVEVDHCTVPQPGDIRLKFLFHRKDEAHRRRAMEAWRNSGSIRTCVGEWHSHPEDYPSPSWMDKCNWRRILQRQGSEPLLFMIVGREGVWAALGTNRAIKQLRVVE